jgi:hypothetical protein
VAAAKAHFEVIRCSETQIAQSIVAASAALDMSVRFKALIWENAGLGPEKTLIAKLNCSERRTANW